MRTVGDLVRAEQELASFRARVNTPTPAPVTTPPPAAAPPPPGPPRCTEQEYSAMDAASRIAYARQFQQPATSPRRGG